MTIPLTTTTPAKPLPFKQGAEAYIEKMRAQWIADIKGTPQEPFAIAYARNEGLIMPNEPLESVTTLSLFLRYVDVVAWAERLERGEILEREAKIGIAADVKRALHDAECGINALRFPKVAEAEKPVLRLESDLAGDKEKEAGLPTPVVLMPPPDASEVLEGVPEGLTSSVIRIHRVVLEGKEAYTLDRVILDYLQAAQVQKFKLSADVIFGDHGLRILAVRPYRLKP